MTAQIEVEDLHLHLGSSSGGTNALDGVSLHVNEGQRLGLVGGSGAGKSTLLKVMMALRQPDSGTVRFRGTSLTDANAIRELRRSAAMVFQDPRSSLDPRMSIGRAITEPLRSPVARTQHTCSKIGSFWKTEKGSTRQAVNDLEVVQSNGREKGEITKFFWRTYP